MMTKSIMIVGVGGQGTLLASRIIGNAALIKGWDVKVSEVHGMSQRGGSVVTYVRFGEDEIASPIVCRGEADLILSFELLEAARFLPYLKIGGLIVTNTQKMNPMPVITGDAAYPEDLVDKMKKAGAKVIAADALALAREAGSEKAVNVALIGLSTEALGIDCETMKKAVEMSVPEAFKTLNLKAFDLGYRYFVK